MRWIDFLNGSDSIKHFHSDYQWGSVGFKVKNRTGYGAWDILDIMTNTEAVEEHWKSQFTENLSIDPKICVLTVLYFPCDATVGDESLF